MLAEGWCSVGGDFGWEGKFYRQTAVAVPQLRARTNPPDRTLNVLTPLTARLKRVKVGNFKFCV